MSTVQITRKDRFAILTIDRPKALNALNADVLRDIKLAVAEVESDPAARAMLFTGAGEKAFVAGADIAAMQNLTPAEAEEFARVGHATMNAVAGSRLISIAAINGFALGGGLELALACDLRLAADNARLGLPEVTLGLCPGFGGTQRLSRVVGRGLALEIILSGDMITAERAYQIGLVNRLFPAAEFAAKAEEFVMNLLKHKSGAAQLAARGAVDAGLDSSLGEGLAEEIRVFGALFAGPDPKQGMTAFLAKSKADF
jgi:enoyl-CoA hydratase